MLFESLNKRERRAILLGVFASALVALVVVFGLILPQTHATWSKPITLSGEKVKNGDIKIVSVGSIEIIPGAKEGLFPGWDSSQKCTSGEVRNNPNSSERLVTGSQDKSFFLRFPVEVLTVGDNLVAVGSVNGTVDQGNNHERYRFSDWKLTDNAGNDVTNVKTGVYYVQANLERNAIDGEAGVSLSSIGTQSKQSIQFNSVDVEIRQVR